MTKRFLAAFCVSVFAAAAAPADSGDLEALIDRARAAPAEFAANALLRLAELPPIKPERKRSLIEEAFRRAAGAQQPLKRRAALLAFRRGPTAFLDKAFAQDLDANSLQCRAVRSMLPLDRKKARDLFRDIPHPRLRRATCDDSLVFDVSAYYDTLAAIAAGGFTPAEVAEDEPFKFVSGYLQGLESPIEIGPIARLLAGAPLKQQQLSGLVMSFSAALKDLAGDDRSFTYTVTRDPIGERIAALAARCAKLDISAVPLVEAYRTHLVRHMGGQRCSDSTEKEGISFAFAAAPQAQLTQDAVAYFNDKLRLEEVKPITGEEVQPSKTEGAAGGVRTCESLECQQMANLYRGLVFGPDGMPYGQEKRTTADWQNKLKEYLAALAAWKDDPSLAGGEYFQQKCALYSEIFNIVPNGPDREAVMRGFLEFLQRNSYQRENRMEWFLPVNSLIARVTLEGAGLRGLMKELGESPDPIISLYADLEQLAPRGPGESLSIM